MARSRVLDLREPLADLRTQPWAGAAYTSLWSAALYLALFLGAAFAPSAWMRIACAVVLGPTIALLFRIAHDCGHGCHFPSAGLNALACRLSLLPAYHPYRTWILLHNQRHHLFTNLRGQDYIWIPLSKPEYDALGPLGRARERCYRTALGAGVYYLYGVWWRQMAAPPRRSRQGAAHRSDRLCVGAFACGQLMLLSVGAPAPAEYAWRLILCMAAPFLIFNWMVGFVSLLNHTHPEVPWFSRREEWSFYAGQVKGTVHMATPPWLFLFITDLGRHGAHHIEPRAPVGRLKQAEARLVALADREMVVERWTTRGCRRILRACKLYDYDAGCWLDFSGRPTSPAWRIAHDPDSAGPKQEAVASA